MCTMRSLLLLLLSSAVCMGQAYKLEMPTLDEICFVTLPFPGTGGMSNEFCGGTLDVTHYYQLEPTIMRHTGFDVEFEFTGEFSFPEFAGSVSLHLNSSQATPLPVSAGLANPIWDLTPTANGQLQIEDDADIIAGFADITLDGIWDYFGTQTAFHPETASQIGSFNDSGVLLDLANYPASIDLTDNRSFIHDFSASFNAPLEPGFYLNRFHADAIDLGRTLTLTQMITLLADANGDNLVDGYDFLVWNDNKYTFVDGGHTMGDFNYSGYVDGQDLLIWNAEKFIDDAFVVPEPIGFGMLCWGCVAVFVRQRVAKRDDSFGFIR